MDILICVTKFYGLDEKFLLQFLMHEWMKLSLVSRAYRWLACLLAGADGEYQRAANSTVCPILTVTRGEEKEQLSITASARGRLSAAAPPFTSCGVQGQVKVWAWRKGHVGEGEGDRTSCGSCLKELGFLAHLQDADPESLMGCWQRFGLDLTCRLCVNMKTRIAFCGPQAAAVFQNDTFLPFLIPSFFVFFQERWSDSTERWHVLVDFMSLLIVR